MAGLEKLSSIQSMQLDENLDKLDSASVLQVQLAAAAAGNRPSLYSIGSPMTTVSFDHGTFDRGRLTAGQ